MKKFLTAVAICVTLPTIALTETVYYPQESCAEIVSQEYSTGGGNTSWQYLEILCKDKDGKYTGFVASWGSVAGFLGAGRWDMVDRFDYVPYKGKTLKVE